jgi:hypothetical protein
VSFRVRLVGALAGLLLAAGAVGVQGSFAASIVLTLNADNTLEVRLDSGARIRTSSPQAVIAPGTYAAVISSEVPEFRDDYHMFHLAGPGVNLQTDLLAGDERAEPHTVILQPNSTYTFRDERNASLGSVVFTTSGSGTTAPGGGSSGGSSGAGSSGGGTTSNTPVTSNKDSVGSKILRNQGSLAGGVTTAGKLSLTFKGKKVGSLKAGRYSISVLDETAKAAFVLQQRRKQPVTVSGKAHVGRATRTVTLTPGQWMFYSTPGRKTFFLVHA